MDFRDLPTKVRRSVDLYVAGLHAENPDAPVRRFGEVREGVDGEAFVTYRDESTGERFEIAAWPDGTVGGYRVLA